MASSSGGRDTGLGGGTMGEPGAEVGIWNNEPGSCCSGRLGGGTSKIESCCCCCELGTAGSTRECGRAGNAAADGETEAPTAPPPAAAAAVLGGNGELGALLEPARVTCAADGPRGGAAVATLTLTTGAGESPESTCMAAAAAATSCLLLRGESAPEAALGNGRAVACEAVIGCEAPAFEAASS